MNIAALYKLPIIYMCENNQYAYATSQERHSVNPHFYTRGQNIVPGLRIDGMNVLVVKENVKFAREYCIENGPINL